MKYCFALAMCCALSLPAFSADHIFASGNDFLGECSVLGKQDSSLTNFDKAKGMQCMAYIAGLIDGTYYEDLRIDAESNNKATKLPPEFCLPEGVVYPQLTRVVLKYIRDNPRKPTRRRWC